MHIVEFCLLNDQTFTLPVGSIVHLMLKRAGHFNYLIIYSLSKEIKLDAAPVSQRSSNRNLSVTYCAIV